MKNKMRIHFSNAYTKKKIWGKLEIFNHKRLKERGSINFLSNDVVVEKSCKELFLNVQQDIKPNISIKTFPEQYLTCLKKISVSRMNENASPKGKRVL